MNVTMSQAEGGGMDGCTKDNIGDGFCYSSY